MDVARLMTPFGRGYSSTSFLSVSSNLYMMKTRSGNFGYFIVVMNPPK